jgi:hypothetical protein
MQDAKDAIPLGHDGYLKLWALSNPVIPADFILLDEAQDTNPVVLDILTRQAAQIVYVGDKYQQIYEWRGAINAMETIATDRTTHLTLSFRFGEAIAEGASKILSLLGERRIIRGNPVVSSRIGSIIPETILARTNASTITAIIEALDADRKPFLVGGTAELIEMLRAVEDLKEGQPSTLPDFFGFQNWQEVVEFSRSGEGEHLLTFVNLVEARGERQLMWALGRTVDESHSDLVISTAHKAKGREWKTVRLMDDFVKSRARRKNEAQNGTSAYDPAELRILYVAFTRAREAIDVAMPVIALIGNGVRQTVHQPARWAPGGSNEKVPITSSSSARSTKPTSEPPVHIRPPKPTWIPPANWQSSDAVLPKLPSHTSVKEEQSQKGRDSKKRGILSWFLGK